MYTTTPSGWTLAYVFGALAKFEMSLISERVNVGLEAPETAAELSEDGMLQVQRSLQPSWKPLTRGYRWLEFVEPVK